MLEADLLAAAERVAPPVPADLPGRVLARLDELPAWLATAHIVPIEDLEQW